MKEWGKDKVLLLIQCYEEAGMSFRQISKTPAFKGSTRNALIGVYNRNRHLANKAIVKPLKKKEIVQATQTPYKPSWLSEAPNFASKTCSKDGCRLPRQPGTPFCASHCTEHYNSQRVVDLVPYDITMLKY